MLVILGPYTFPVNFRISLLIFTEKAIGILIGIIIGIIVKPIWINLGTIDLV